MLTFEEYLRKKKIDLSAFRQGEQKLFNEFATHYTEMGEKSFDYTKKYLFNKLRRQYQLAPEVKADKPHVENKLAEQTVIDSLSAPAENITPLEETLAPPAKMGFKPKFKAASMHKPAVKTEEPKAKDDETAPSVSEQVAKPSLGFKPKFKSAVTNKTEEKTKKDIKQEVAESKETTESVTPKLGFKPKFKTVPVPGKEADNQQQKVAGEANSDEAKPTLGFTPKFRAGVTKSTTSATPTPKDIKQEEAVTEPAKTKLGFTPKFKSAAKPASGKKKESGSSDNIPSDKVD